jgi:hypothetical protein
MEHYEYNIPVSVRVVHLPTRLVELTNSIAQKSAGYGRGSNANEIDMMVGQINDRVH